MEKSKNTNVTLDEQTREYVQKVKGVYPKASFSQIISLLAAKGREAYEAGPLSNVAEALLKK